MTPQEEFDRLISYRKKGKKIEKASSANFIYSWDGLCGYPERGVIDYAKLFLQCPSYLQDVSEDVFFNIDWEKQSHSSTDSSILTVFVVSLFLSTMKDIIRAGLKKDYVERNENLKAKVKGRVLHGYNISKNILLGHQERFFCSYQEYTVDNAINQLLKATLIIARDLITSTTEGSTIYKSNGFDTLIEQCLTNMQTVRPEPHPYMKASIVSVPHGKLYKNYEKALDYARLLLKLDNAYFISKENNNRNVFPDFWIYLPTLFEHFIYGKMKKEDSQIEIQPVGIFNQRADFIFHNPDIVVDAKLKGHYLVALPSKDDFTALSRYSRDEKYFSSNTNEVPCIIVYPLTKPRYTLPVQECKNITAAVKVIFSPADFKYFQPIPGMRNFYKVGIQLPCLE